MDRTSLERLALRSSILAFGISAGCVYSRYRADMLQSYRRVSSGSQTIETACGPVQYTEFGAGPPILVAHGAGGGYDQGAYFARLIGGNFRWIAPSRFGFLGTPVPEEADSALQADAYACLLDSLAIDQVGVIGVSMGGPSALLFAANHPTRTKSLVLISAASYAIPSRPAIQAIVFNLFLNDFVFWLMVQLSPQGLLAILGVPLRVQKRLTAEEVARLRAFLGSIMPMGARKSGQLLEQHMSEYETQKIRTIRAPTLVLHARDDTLVTHGHGEFSARSISDARFISLERGGHLALMFGSHAGMRQELQAFLRQHNE